MLVTIALTLISCTFLLCTHPISMTISTIFAALMISISSGLWISSFWPSYILLLIYLGGMLIIFSYIASLTPNSPFFKIKKMKFSFILLISSLVLLSSHTTDSPEFINITPINKMFSLSLFPVTITLISFLLVSLLSISSILKMNWSPLKMFN